MTATEVWSNLKNKDECGCGHDECDGFGVLGPPDGKGRRHAPNCDPDACEHCRNGRNRRTGLRRQARATTSLGMPRSSLRPGNEESLGGAVRVEVKAGAQVQPAWTAFRRMEEQSEGQRPFGDHRPFVAVAEGDDDGLVMIRRSRIAEAVAALAEQLGMVQ